MGGLLATRVANIVDQLCPDPLGQVEFELDLPEAYTQVSLKRNGPGEFMWLSIVKDLKERSNLQGHFEDYHIMHSFRHEGYSLKDCGYGKFIGYDREDDELEGYWFGSIGSPPYRHLQEVPLVFNGMEFRPRFTPEKVRKLAPVLSDDMLAQALLTIEQNYLLKPRLGPEPPAP